MPEIVECDCIVELAIPQKLDQIFCVLSTLASGEAGDATAANQTLEIAQLTAINGNTDALPAALGQAAMAASLPVVIASDQSSFGTKDAGPNWTSVFGVAGARFTSANASAADAAVTDAPTAGQKLVPTDVLISVDTAMRVDLKEETSGTVIASIYMAANTSQQITFRSKVKLATADKKLMVRTSVAGNIAVTTAYFSEA